MIKTLEKISAAVLFIVMFVFLSQFEGNAIGFWTALGGVVSCGALSILLFMHGFAVHFYVEFDENDEPIFAENIDNSAATYSCKSLSHKVFSATKTA